MHTYIVEHVLKAYTDGLIVVKAKNKKEAVELILKEMPDYDFKDDCLDDDGNYDPENQCSNIHNNTEYLLHNIREIKKNEVVYVAGGG